MDWKRLPTPSSSEPRPAAGGKLPRRPFVAVVVATTSLVLLFAANPLSGAEAPRPPEFLVVVNVKNPVGHVERGFLADAFLKKVSHWHGRETIRPADQLPRAAVRRAFSAAVLNRSVDAVRHYWQQRIFSGRDIPPPEFESDAAVLAYVAKHEGAVGYVSAAPTLDGVKVIAVR